VGPTARSEALAASLRPLLDARDYHAIHSLLARAAVPEVADVLRDADPDDRLVLFRLLPHDLGADVFAELETVYEDEILSALSSEETRALLASIAPDDRTELFEELPGAATQKLINLLSPEDLAETRRFLGYPEESIGRLATPEYVAVRPEWSASRALGHVRAHGRDSETVNVVYIVDRRWRLLGSVSLRRLILAEADAPVSDLLVETHALSAFEDRENAVGAMRRYDAVALPVVDSSGVLIGIVTVDDVLDVAEEEATEDAHRTASVMPLRASYGTLSVWELYGKRVGWLAILLVVNLFSSGIISAYEEMLASVIALTFFIPLLIATGGNTGSQSAMMMVRAIVTEDVMPRAWFATFLKEIGVGVLLGGTLAVGAFALGALRADPRIGIVVGLAMVAIVIVSNLVGMTLPFVLTRLKQDPTVASSPLVTTLADVLGLTIYFGIATVVLGL
jgi:magnesium transporter